MHFRNLCPDGWLLPNIELITHTVAPRTNRGRFASLSPIHSGYVAISQRDSQVDEVDTFRGKLLTQDFAHVLSTKCPPQAEYRGQP